MKKLAILIAIVLCLISAAPMVAGNDGVISGQIINGTPEGDGTANLELNLEGYTADSAEPLVISGQADDEGNFIFLNIDTDSAISYYIVTAYAGVEYVSDEIVFTEGEAEKTVQMTVYETTEDDSGVVIYWSHTVIAAENDNLNISEFFYILNDADRTYTGSQEVLSVIRVSIVLPIPAEARDLQLGPEVGGNAIFTDNGLACTLPLVPGFTQVSYVYTLPDPDSDYAYSRQMDYDQYFYDVLLQGIESAESQQLTKQDPIEEDGVTYEYLSGEGIPAGQAIVVQLSGLPKDTSQQTVLWALGTLVLLGGLFALLLRRGGAEAPASVPESEEQQLLAKITRLDDDFETGLIDEERYRLERSTLKNRIIRIRQRSEED